MRVVVDTNVLVSAVLRDRIPQEVILFITAHEDVEWIAIALAIRGLEDEDVPEYTLDDLKEVF